MDTTATAMIRPHLQATDPPTAAVQDASPLRFTVERCSSATLVRVGGEVDVSNVAVWRCLLAKVAGGTAAPGPLIIDTRHLDFIGVCGLAALADTSAHCRARRTTVCLVGDQPHLTRILTLCQWDRELTVYPDVDAALTAGTQIQIGA